MAAPYAIAARIAVAPAAPRVCDRLKMLAERRIGQPIALQREAGKLAKGGDKGGRKGKAGLRKNPAIAPRTLADQGVDKNLADQGDLAIYAVACMSEKKVPRGGEAEGDVLLHHASRFARSRKAPKAFRQRAAAGPGEQIFSLRPRTTPAANLAESST